MDALAVSVVDKDKVGMATGIFNTVRVSADGVAIAVLSALLAFLIQARLGAALPADPALALAANRAALGVSRGVRPAAGRGRPCARATARPSASCCGCWPSRRDRADLRAARQARRRARRRPGHGLSVRPAPGACVPPGPARPLAARRDLPAATLAPDRRAAWRALIACLHFRPETILDTPPLCTEDDIRDLVETFYGRSGPTRSWDRCSTAWSTTGTST